MATTGLRASGWWLDWLAIGANLEGLGRTTLASDLWTGRCDDCIDFIQRLAGPFSATPVRAVLFWNRRVPRRRLDRGRLQSDECSLVADSRVEHRGDFARGDVADVATAIQYSFPVAAAVQLVAGWLVYWCD